MNRVDNATGKDSASLGVAHGAHDKLGWKCVARVEKFHGTAEEGNLETKPYEVIEREGNLLTTAGIAVLLDLLTAEAAPTAYSNAACYLAVGSSAQAEVIGDTTLVTELARVAMDGVYPTRTVSSCDWRGVFSGATGDGAWEEWGLLNAGAAGDLLNRKTTSFGTKSGGTWTFTVTITIS